jgi:hypothetical protein
MKNYNCKIVHTEHELALRCLDGVRWLQKSHSTVQIVCDPTASSFAYLGEEVMDCVGPDIMDELAEDAIVTIDRCQPSPQVAPLLPSVPRHLLLRVAAPMVVEVCHNVKPHDEDPVWDPVQIDHGGQAKRKGSGSKDAKHGDHDWDWMQKQRCRGAIGSKFGSPFWNS